MPQFDPIVRISTDLESGGVVAWDENLTDRIIAFSFTDKARGADEISVTFRNNDGVLLDDERLKPDSRLLILYGYPHLSRTARVTIKKIEGFWTLTVKGPASEAARFLGSQRSRSFDGVTEWEVAEEIAIGLGFTGDDDRVIDNGDIAEVRRGISQTSETDWAFLQRLADRVDCVVYVRDGVFHFHPPSLDARPIKEIVFFDSETATFIEPPRIEYGTIGRASRVDTRGVSTEERAEVRGTASNREDTSRPALGDTVALREMDDALASLDDEVLEQAIGFVPGEDGGQRSVMPTASQSDEEAQRHARRAFRGSERESVKIEALLVGDPELVADETVRISGIGQRFSGPYLLDEVTHAIEGSYKTKIKGRRNAVSRSSTSRRGLDSDTTTEQREPLDLWEQEQERELDEIIGLVNPGDPAQSRWDRYPSSGTEGE